MDYWHSESLEKDCAREYYPADSDTYNGHGTATEYAKRRWIPQLTGVLAAPRRVLQTFFIVIYYICLSAICCHTIMVLCESFAIVRSNRNSDDDLADLCHHGAAASSAKMRKACLDMAHEHSSPFAVAVLMGTFQILRGQLWFYASAPFRSGIISSLIPFVVCAPWCMHALRWLGVLKAARIEEHMQNSGARIVVVASQPQPQPQSNCDRRPGTVRRRASMPDNVQQKNCSRSDLEDYHCLTFGTQPVHLHTA
mgnify:CR=1 FL=1|tara:strand:+ start:1049 stop:1807 length:759 start_codon:yes stop_codon:yes gene_type:complete